MCLFFPIAGTHDPTLVGLAFLISVFAACTALSLAGRAVAAEGSARGAWLAMSAIATGGGIWSMHFIAMLAFDLGIPVGYDAEITVASLLVAVAVTGLGLVAAIRGGGRPRGLLLGGAAMGAGVAAMHYTGMAAMRMEAAVSYRPPLVALSVLTAVVAATAALWLALKLRRWWQRATAAVVMGVAINGMHYTGMAAAVFTPATDPLAAVGPVIEPTLLALAIAGAAVTVLSLGLVSSVFDQRLADRAREEAERLRESEERFRSVAEAAGDAIVAVDAIGRIVFWNGGARAIFGYRADEVVGQPLAALMPERYRNAHAAGLARLRAGGEPRVIGKRMEVHGLRRDGAEFPLELSLSTWVQGERVFYGGIMRDLTERRRNEQRMMHMAHHDALTDLPNRVLFRDRLRQAVARLHRGQGAAVAVLCLDLDRFKEVNDTLGHPGGDALLKAVADRLLGALRETDTVARLGGDEFAVVQVGLDQPDGASALARRLLRVLTEPFELDGHEILTGASVGIALAPADGRDADTLLKNADIALYRAKAEGRGTCRFFEPEMDARLQQRRALERDLRRALAQGEFTLHYQPQVDCGSRRLIGFEALLRWPRPGGAAAVPPAEFIPIAEESGLILPLGEWVLRRACAEAAAWPEPLRVAVNLSPAQFKHGDLPGLVRDALTAANLAPARLELEITEGVLLQNTEAAIETLRRLKELGVRVAMDDFGTGYSSLSYLRRFPFDKIKIDRSFIHGIEDGAEAAAIVRAIVGLGRSLGMPTTAEGVETEAQLRLLQREGCREAQGFLLGHPIPPDDVEGLLRSRAARP